MTNEGFKCQECNRVFQNRFQLTAHAVVHLPAEQLPFACDQCGRRFTRNANLLLHIKTHDPERKKELKCDVCGKGFFEARILERHKKTHEEGKFACDECGERFRRGRSLIAHKKKQHNQDRIFVCSDCPKVFHDEKKFKRHLTIHTPYEERKFVCDQCGNRFLTKQFLDIHKRTHEERDRSFICKECGKGFLNAVSLNNHQKTHMKYEDWPALCEICGRRFQDNTQLKGHIWNKHTEKETFDCERCGKPFLTEEQLAKHLNNKTMCKERKIQCPYCDKVFTNGYWLKIHKQGVHKDIVEFECPKCEETFGNLEEMEAHRQTHEEGFTCNICQKVLYSVEGFNQHMQRHEQSRKESSPKKKRGRPLGKKILPPPKYVCQDCKRSFSSMIKLNEHSVKCPRKMGSMNLQTPAQVTAGAAKTNENSIPDKNIPCPFCGKLLASKYSLISHLRRACPKLKEDFTCQMCNTGKMNLLQALIHVAECKVNCNKTIQCSFCLKEMPASNYPLHIQTEIIKYKLKNPFHLKCKYCSLSLPNQKILLLHQRMCKPPPIKQARPSLNFICGVCNWTSSTDLDMINHVKESHSIIVTTMAQDKALMPISSAFGLNKEKTYRFEPIYKCFVCSARFYCQVAGKFHVRSCQKRYGTVTETVNEAANPCEDEQAKIQKQDEDGSNAEASTGVPRLVLVTF